MDFNQVLDWWHRLPQSAAAVVWLTLVVVIFIATFFWRMHKRKDVWSALKWAAWNALSLLLANFFLPTRFNDDAEDRREKRRKRRSGSLTDEF